MSEGPYTCGVSLYIVSLYVSLPSSDVMDCMCLRFFKDFVPDLRFSVCIFSHSYIKFINTLFDLGQFSVDGKRGIYCRIDCRYFYL